MRKFLRGLFVLNPILFNNFVRKCFHTDFGISESEEKELEGLDVMSDGVIPEDVRQEVMKVTAFDENTKMTSMTL